MPVKRTGRFLVALALLMTSVPLASHASCVPTQGHVLRLGHLMRSHVRIHQSRIGSVQKTSPTRDPNYDTFADMWLG